MIQEKTFGNAMTKRESFDDFYTRKLEALKIELKSCIKGDTPYVASDVYACKCCRSRIFLHTFEGAYYCMRCRAMPSSWSIDLKARVDAILERYPDIEESRVEYEASKPVPTKRQLSGNPTKHTGNTELGTRIREARESMGLTQGSLASKVRKKNGKMLTEKSILSYERGWAYPPIHILGQLRDILGLEVVQNEQ